MKNLPGLPANSLRQLQHVRRDFLGYLLEAAKLGDLVRLHPAPGYKIVLVNHPLLVREVLVTRANEFRKTRMTGRMVGKFLGQGLVLAEGEEHQRQRQLLAPLFSPRRLADCAPLLHANAVEFFGSRTGHELPVQEAMTEVALRGVLQILFGADEGATGAVSEAMRTFADSMASRFRSMPLPDWVPTRRNRLDAAAIHTLDNAIVELLIHRRTRASMKDADVIDTLLAAQHEHGLSFRNIRDQVATLYFAGHETTAKLLTWASLLIACNPDLGRALNTEAATLPDPPSAEDLDRLPLLTQVLHETLRLYPPAWLFDREPIQDVQLGNATLAAGTTMYLSPFVMHRDGRWWQNPNVFDPERFSAGWEERNDRLAYLPFGSGARHCIGRALALLQAKATLAALMRGYRVSSDKTDLDGLTSPGATLGLSHPVTIRLSPIANWEPRKK